MTHFLPSSLSGRCICTSGYSGPRCDRPCPKGFYGVGCKQACPPCTSGYGTCDFLTGQCECEPGYTGFFCAEPCPRGTFGRRCLGKCDCKVCMSHPPHGEDTVEICCRGID